MRPANDPLKRIRASASLPKNGGSIRHPPATDLQRALHVVEADDQFLRGTATRLAGV
jgi:hypothetical protein